MFMLAKAKRIDEIENVSKYIAEFKYDGTRAIAKVNVKERRVELINRRNFNIAFRYPEIVNSLLKQKENCILDGEIVVFDKENKVNFYLLQKREVDDPIKIEILSRVFPATYIVFDILQVGDKDLRKVKLIERKKILKEFLKESNYVKLCPFFLTFDIKSLLKEAIEKGFEGIMLKDKESFYQSKRSDDWIKIKKSKDVDAIVIGYTIGEGLRRETFGALLIALLKQDKFFIIGKVGTGFSFNESIAIVNKLKEIEVDKSFYQGKIENEEVLKKFENVIFVKPKIVVKVKFLEVTEDFQLRAPVFVAIRNDKPIEDCTFETLL